jgi:hypothetical protein
MKYRGIRSRPFFLSSPARSLREACKEIGRDESERRCPRCPVKSLCKDTSPAGWYRAIGNPLGISIELSKHEVGSEGFVARRCRKSAGSPSDGCRLSQADGCDDRPSRTRKRRRSVETTGSGYHPVLCAACAMGKSGSEDRVAEPMRRDARKSSRPLGDRLSPNR